MSCNPGICPLCGGPNTCQLAGVEVNESVCWCCQVEPDEKALERVPPELRNRACLCRNCLERKPKLSDARLSDGACDAIKTI